MNPYAVDTMEWLDWEMTHACPHQRHEAAHANMIRWLYSPDRPKGFPPASWDWHNTFNPDCERCVEAFEYERRTTIGQFAELSSALKTLGRTFIAELERKTSRVRGQIRRIRERH